ELGESSARLHQSVADVIDTRIDAVLTLGNDAKEISKAVQNKDKGIMCRHFDSEKALIKTLHSCITSRTLLLFKASLGMHFENIIGCLYFDLTRTAVWHAEDAYQYTSTIEHNCDITSNHRPAPPLLP